jgi:peptide methionine sulfoxide reductase msrA/msrB
MRYLFLIFLIVGCTQVVQEEKNMAYPDNTKIATFAGGCFWCMEAAFEERDGIIEVISGYTAGEEEDPSYQEVSSGKTGHLEAVQVIYDPLKISYSELIDIFWKQIDPTDDGGQFAERGPQYRTAIFYQNEDEKRIAEESKGKLDKSKKFDKPIVTQILKATRFFKAEEYHQDYYKKRTIQYQLYASGSGRKKYIKETWGEDGKK